MADTSGMRSGLERQIAAWLDKNGIKYEYESKKIKYTSSVKGGVCPKCGTPAIQNRVYTPDFWFPDHGFFLEAKGRFTSHDRKKMRDVKRSNPELDIRMLFPSNNKIDPGKDDRYSDWCDKFEFMYSLRGINAEWFK
jgi:hypothetical protein